ncbi:hypothetical protein ACH4GM_20310 [Streptomyces coeruleorubidus]
MQTDSKTHDWQIESRDYAQVGGTRQAVRIMPEEGAREALGGRAVVGA